MVLETKIEAKVVAWVDKWSFNKIEQTARDTWKKINQDLKVKMEVDIAKAQLKLKELRKQLRSKDLTEAQRLKLQIDTNAAQRNVTELKRRLNNLVNTGKATTSRLWRLFKSVWNQVRQLWVAIAWVFAIRKLGDFLKDWVQKSISLEKWLARINTVARVSKKELAWLWDEIKKISKEFWISSDILLETWFNISSAWVKFKDLTDIMRLSSKIAIGASTDTNTAFEGVISVIKGYWLEMSKSTKVADLFFKTNELWQTTVWDVASSIWQVATIAKNAKIPLEELFWVYSTLTWVTWDANRVTTQLKAAILALSAPTAEASAKLKKMWVDVGAAAIEQKWFVQVAKDVYDSVNWNQEQLRKLVPSVEALTLVTALATDQFDVYNNKLNQLENSHWALDLAVSKMEATTSQKLSKIKESWNSFKETVWWALIDVWFLLLKFKDKISEFQNWWPKPFKPISDELDNLNKKLNKQVENFNELELQQKELSKSYRDWSITIDEYSKSEQSLIDSKKKLLDKNRQTAVQRDLEIERLKTIHQAETDYKEGIDNLTQAKETWQISNKKYESSLRELQNTFNKNTNIVWDYHSSLDELNKQRPNTAFARSEYEKLRKQLLSNIKTVAEHLKVKLAEAKALWDTESMKRIQRATFDVAKAYISAKDSVWDFTWAVKEVKPVVNNISWWVSRSISKSVSKSVDKAANDFEKYYKSANKVAESIKELTWEHIELNKSLLKNKDTATWYIASLNEYEKAAKDMTTQVGKAYDWLTSKIKKSQDAQKSLKDDLKWIDKDIASRIVEIDKKLAWTDINPTERIALQNEKSLAYKWLSQEDKTKLETQVKDIAEYEKKTEIEKLQILKTQKETALQEEITREQELVKQKEALWNAFEEYLKWKVEQEATRAEQLRQKWLAVAAARAKIWSSWTGDNSWVWARADWWPVSAWSPYIVGERWPELMIPETNGRIIPNHNLTVNQNVNANVANWVDIDALAQQLARKITLAGKWLL